MKTPVNEKVLREALRILVRKLGILEKSEFTSCEITLAQCHAIVEMGRTEKISLNELAETLNLDNSTMSRTVNNLVNNGLAVRETDPEDRRYVTIKLTEKGQELFMSIEESMEVYYKRIFTAIPEDDRQKVLESMDILLRAINESKCCE
ncbi:MAG: MarR family winged helix-turn-helix transcriptional regulator [Clostridia bacterium]|nr:MarR family winged helix-turn-helix transcriptional regulator [Clostridia bacterium]